MFHKILSKLFPQKNSVFFEISYHVGNLNSKQPKLVKKNSDYDTIFV